MQGRTTSKSGNAFRDWLDRAARPSFVSLIIFEDFYVFRRISQHSLVGLDNGAMLLLGGRDNGSGGAAQTGIWELKNDQWSRIGELLKV
jgi:hypothetical protein